TRSQYYVGLKEGHVVADDAAQDVVIDHHAPDAAVLRQRAGLRLDLLRGEDAGDRGEQRVPAEQLEVAGELLHSVDLATSLHLDRHRRAEPVAAEQVDRTDRGRVLAPDQREA